MAGIRQKLAVRATILLVCVFCAGQALADMPMLPIFAVMRLWMWWLLVPALLIETVVLRLIFGNGWRRALWLAIAVNLISMAAGFVLYPVVGVMGYALLEDWVVAVFGSSSSVEISALAIGAALVDTGVELAALRFIWSIQMKKWSAVAFLLANLASAGLLIAALAWDARAPRLRGAELIQFEAEYADEIALIGNIYQSLPDHTDAEGRVDAAWMDDLVTRSEGLRFLQLMIGTNGHQFSVVQLGGIRVGESYAFSYGRKSKHGEAELTRGTITKYDLENPDVSETRKVLHYNLWREKHGRTYMVRSILKAAPNS